MIARNLFSLSDKIIGMASPSKATDTKIESEKRNVGGLMGSKSFANARSITKAPKLSFGSGSQ